MHLDVYIPTTSYNSKVNFDASEWNSKKNVQIERPSQAKIRCNLSPECDNVMFPTLKNHDISKLLVLEIPGSHAITESNPSIWESPMILRKGGFHTTTKLSSSKSAVQIRTACIPITWTSHFRDCIFGSLGILGASPSKNGNGTKFFHCVEEVMKDTPSSSADEKVIGSLGVHPNNAKWNRYSNQHSEVPIPQKLPCHGISQRTAQARPKQQLRF